MTLTDQVQLHACPVCSSTRIAPWRVRVVSNASWKIDRCVECGFAFVNPRPGLDFLMKYYSEHGKTGLVNRLGRQLTLKEIIDREESFPNSTIDARRIISTIKKLRPMHERPKFLDVGCGYGFFSRQALEAGFDVTAIEIADSDRMLSQEMLGLLPLSVPFEEFQYTPSTFDCVLMSQTLEHALDINLWVQTARDCLVDGGVLAIAVPNFGSVFRLALQENDPFITPPEHLNYFSIKSLSRLLENHGFRVDARQYISRIPSTAFESRMPKSLTFVLPAINIASKLSLRIIDALRLGMIINVYGVKAR